jgi:hypothetical protein
MGFFSMSGLVRQRNRASTTRASVRSGFLITAIGALLLCRAATGRADTIQPVDLVWARGDDADGCATSHEIKELVSQRLGVAPFSPDARRTIETIVERREGRWVARIQIRDQQGHTEATRELTSESTDCSPIQNAAVLAIAIAIDPNARFRPVVSASETAMPALPPALSVSATSPSPIPPSAESPAPTVVPAPRIAPVVPAPHSAPVVPAPHSAPVAHEPIVSSLTLRAGLSDQLVPGTSPVAGLVGTLPIAESWSIAAQSLLVAESPAPDDRFEFGLTAFGLGSCYQTSGSWSTGLCASAWLGSIGAVVHSVPPTHPGGRTFTAASVETFSRAGLLGPLHIELAGGVFVPVQRRTFTVEGLQDPVWRQPAMAGAIFVGVGLQNF